LSPLRVEISLMQLIKEYSPENIIHVKLEHNNTNNYMP
jgi:hypothetical protein